MLSRKAEGLDPMKPWQPPNYLGKVLNSTNNFSNYWKDNEKCFLPTFLDDI
jgi:hypothetical protein